MGVSLTFTDEQFTLAPLFMDFLYRHFHGGFADQRWHDQLSEGLSQDENVQRTAVEQAENMMRDPRAQKAVLRSYELLSAFLTGNSEQLKPFHYRYNFICVVGAPRHGGSYLTKQLFRALGYDAGAGAQCDRPRRLPRCDALRFRPGLQRLHADDAQHGRVPVHGRTVLRQCARLRQHDPGAEESDQGGLPGRIFRPRAGAQRGVHHHPAPPGAGRDLDLREIRRPAGQWTFAVRGNIESWVRRDNIYAGMPEGKAEQIGYFDAYLSYWEHYHYNLLLTGLRLNPKWRVVAYGKERLEGLAAGLFRASATASKPDEFKVFDKRAKHPDWMRQAEPVVRRVSDVWRQAGVDFPFDEVMEAW
jgi:hypothetical protein